MERDHFWYIYKYIYTNIVLLLRYMYTRIRLDKIDIFLSYASLQFRYHLTNVWEIKQVKITAGI